MVTTGGNAEKPHFPGFDRLYWLMDPGSTVAFVGDVSLTKEEMVPVLRGSRRPDAGVLSITWAMGRSVPADFIWTTLAIPLVVSSKVVSVLGSVSASGWSSHSVAVTGKRGERISGYSYLSIVGRCGAMLFERSTTIEKQYPGGIFPAYRGFYFDPATWDGSDVFMPSDDSAVVFCTERVQNGLVRAKTSNVKFERLDLSERSYLR